MWNNKIFDENIFTQMASIVEAQENQSTLLKTRVEFNNRSRTKNKGGKNKKTDTYESSYALYEGEELTLIAFKSGKFSTKATKS